MCGQQDYVQVCTLKVNPLCPFPIGLPGLQQSDLIQPKLESGRVPLREPVKPTETTHTSLMVPLLLGALLVGLRRNFSQTFVVPLLNS